MRVPFQSGSFGYIYIHNLHHKKSQANIEKEIQERTSKIQMVRDEVLNPERVDGPMVGVLSLLWMNGVEKRSVRDEVEKSYGKTYGKHMENIYRKHMDGYITTLDIQTPRFGILDPLRVGIWMSRVNPRWWFPRFFMFIPIWGRFPF